MRNVIRTIVIIAGMLLATSGLVAFTGATASADTPVSYLPTCVGVDTNIGANTCVEEVKSSSSDSSYTSSKASSVNGVKVSSNTKVLSFIKAKGMSKAQQHRAKSITIHSSMTFNTSYYNIYHQEVWHMKTYPAGYTFYLGSDGYYHDPKCYNKVVGLPKGPKKAPPAHVQLRGKYKIVDRFRFSTSSESVVKGSVGARSLSWANLYNEAGQQTCHSQASGTGSASYYAKGKAAFRGRVFISISAAVKASQTAANIDLQAQLGGKTKFDLVAQTMTSAKGAAYADATSEASCISNVPPQSLTCPQVYGPGYTGTYPNCTKDGTTTPPTPPGSGGTNPGPSDPGESYQCYSEETGEPVTPNPDGTCPVGSWGS